MDQSPAAAAQRLTIKKQALILAVSTGNTETVEDLLDGGVPIDTKDAEGVSLLHGAALGGHVTTMRLLIRKGCDINSVDARGLTPLHFAAGVGRTNIVQELIRNGASCSMVAGELGTPLHQAAGKGHVETAVAMLMEECSFDVTNSVGHTILHAAAGGGHVELVRELVGRGCDVNAEKANGCTPLHEAAGCGRTRVVCKLIKLGANKSVVAGMYGTPLHLAAYGGHMGTTVAMLEKGCPLNVKNSAGATVLHFVAAGGHTELLRELVSRGCDVNAEETNRCTPLHYAAANGKTEAIDELIKRGAVVSVNAGKYGTPLHQAVVDGNVKAVEALLVSQPTSHNVASSKGIIDNCDLFGRTPVMWALRYGHVELLRLLISKGGDISDKSRDAYSLSVFEQSFVGGQANKMSQFCKASGITSSEGDISCALSALITRGLVDPHKVLSLCAITGDSLFLTDQFTTLIAFKTCAMPAAVMYTKCCFDYNGGASFISKLRIPDESALNPLQMALLALKCFKRGFAIGSLQRGAKDHTLFITKLLSHPVLKERVNENFPNGLSPLDLALKFEFHHIASLIEQAGGRPGLWATVPHEIAVRHPLALTQMKEAYASIKAIAESGEHGLEFIKDVFSSILGAQTVASVVQVDVRSRLLVTKGQDSSWHPNAMIVGASVGPETDEHEYKSLMVPVDKTKKPPQMRPCKDVSEVLKKVVDHSKEINAMLNHHTSGTVHFGIKDESNAVEEGLDLPQAALIDKLQTRVGQLLQEFYPAVQSRYVAIQPIDLLSSSGEPIGRWRFDVCVTPHDKVVVMSRSEAVAYYRQGGNSQRMPADMLMKRMKDFTNLVCVYMMFYVVTAFILLVLVITLSLICSQYISSV